MGSYFPSPFFMFASWYNIFFYIKKNRRSFSSPDLHAPLRAPENFSGDRYFDVISTLSFSFVSLQNTKGNQKRAISVHILVYHPNPGKRSSSFLAGASGLEAFSHNPADGSSAPLASRPSAKTNYLNQRFLSYWVELLLRRPVISRVKLTCLTTV